MTEAMIGEWGMIGAGCSAWTSSPAGQAEREMVE